MERRRPAWGEARGRLRLAAFLLVLAGAPASAVAQPRDPPAQKKDAAASARALELFEQSKLAYREGRFDDAIAMLREAYGLAAEPVLLYNLARAHEGKGQLEEAVAAYEQYLGVAKDVQDRAGIEKKVESLRLLAEERRALATERAASEAREREAAKKPAAAPPPEEDEATGPSLAPWIVAGAGGLILGGGAVVGILALSGHSSAEEAPSQQEAADEQSSAEGLATVSTVLFIVGGVTLAGGATWGIIDLTSGSSSEGSARLHVGPTGVAVRGAF